MSTLTPVIKTVHQTSTSDAAKPPVLLVGTFLSAIDGAYLVCEDLAEQLSATNWRVLTTSAKTNRAARVVDMLATIWRMRRQYALAHVDVFQGSAFLWAEAACRMLRLLGKPYVVTLRSGDFPSFALRRPDRVRRLLRAAAAVTAPSSYLVQEMKSYREDLHLVPNAMRLDRYPFRLRTQIRPRLVWLRGFNQRYNPCLAAHVLALLRRDFTAVHLTMIGRDRGDGSRTRFDNTVSSLHLQDRLNLPGGVPKPEVPHWLNQGDIFLNTTNVDNTPISVLEAMACGLCVVSTDVGGIPHLLSHEKDALLVPQNDPHAMAAAVRRLLTEPGLAERLSEAGRKTAEQFDWSIVRPQWDKLLASVVSNYA